VPRCSLSFSCRTPPVSIYANNSVAGCIFAKVASMSTMALLSTDIEESVFIFATDGHSGFPLGSALLDLHLIAKVSILHGSLHTYLN
jgi:hypothetical protein